MRRAEQVRASRGGTGILWGIHSEAQKQISLKRELSEDGKSKCLEDQS